MKTTRCAFLAFGVGFIAGTAPILMMHYFPAALSPGMSQGAPPAIAILITGIVVGLITCVMFAEQIGEKPLHDIFLYALGIPAVLLATIGNIRSEFEKASIAETASATIVSSPEAETPAELESVDVDSLLQFGSRSPLRSWFGVTEARAQAPAAERLAGTRIAPSGDYLIVIGRFGDASRAARAFRRMREQRLRTEKYVPKQLDLVRSGREYLLVYQRTPSRDEAIKTYKLLRVNDPKVRVELLHY
jgi:hypothetical protein